MSVEIIVVFIVIGVFLILWLIFTLNEIRETLKKILQYLESQNPKSGITLFPGNGSNPTPPSDRNTGEDNQNNT